jgi:Protein of unknown function (DUF1064)
MSWADLLRVTAENKHRRSKYRNLETVVDGHAFDSRREAARYRELRLLERAGEIAGLELQPAYVLHAPVLSAAGELVGLKAIGKYIADFKYRELASGLDVVEDSKGVRTPVYRLKKKIIAVEYGITIRET